jgi:hypothetical protein
MCSVLSPCGEFATSNTFAMFKVEERRCDMSHYSYRGNPRFRAPRSMVLRGPFREGERLQYRAAYRQKGMREVLTVMESLGTTVRFKEKPDRVFDVSFFEHAR